MTFLIGTDEAGYGPNLGPLTVSASVFEVPDDAAESDLYESLSELVSVKADAEKIAIADSKALYKPKGDLSLLERGVYTALGALGRTPSDWRTLWTALGASTMSEMNHAPWYADFNCDLPRAASINEIENLIGRWHQVLGSTGIKLLDLRSVAVFPWQFNAGVQRWGNKATLLSHTTLELARTVMTDLPQGDVLLHCDKHGGRNRYAGVLQHIFEDDLITVRDEGQASSSYQWGPAERRVTARFVAKGEGFLPAALASMACKLLRELAMLAFNQFWQSHLPNLKATAGYPVDAKRFRSEIAEVQKSLAVEDNTLWRER